MDEESDCFAGIADDIATNRTRPSVNSEETILFRLNFLLQKTGQAKRSWYAHTVTHSIETWRNLIFVLGSFSRCTSSTNFRWALLHFKSIRKVYLSMLKLKFRLLDWRFLSVMSAVAVGFLPRSQVNPQCGQNRHQKETRVRRDSFFFFFNENVILKRIAQFKIYLLLHQAQFGCMENYTQYNSIAD